MAQKMVTVLECDLGDDGHAGEETVDFALGGRKFEIDLCAEHAEEMRDTLSVYVGSARRAGSGGRRGRRTAGSSGGGDRQRAQDIRAWAKKKGLKVSDRGRVPADIMAQYDAARR